jgi:hypothetical protein
MNKNVYFLRFDCCKYDICFLIRIIKFRRIRWAGHVAHMGRRGMHIGFWWESQEERGH